MHPLIILVIILTVLQTLAFGLIFARFLKDKKTLGAIDTPTVIRLNSGELRIGPKTLVEKYVEEGKGTRYEL